MNRMTVEKQTFDEQKAGEFFGHVASVLEHGAVAVMLSVGHRTGLLSALANLPASTSQEIADTAGLDERYVREWLAVMVTGRIVAYDAKTRRYRLPAEHAACLTPGGSMGNMAVYAQSVALAGRMQDPLLAVFKSGEGIPYGEYPCFHQVMAEDSDQTVVGSLDVILESLVPELLPRLERGIDVLDAGCGAGHAAIRLAQLYPSSRFSGLDLCEDAIEMARNEARMQGVDNVRFEVVDLAQYNAPETFDVITSFDAVHDTKDPQALLKTIQRALRKDGVHIMQDIGGSKDLENNLDFPFAALLYTMSCMHCTPVSLAQGGEGLGTMWGWETAEALLKKAGFTEVKRTVFPHDPMNVWFVSR